MRGEDDRAVGRARHDHGEIAELDVAEARDGLPPDVHLRGEPVLRQRRDEPVGRALVECAAGDAARVAVDEVSRQRQRRGAVERGRKRRGRQRTAARHGQGRDHERQHQHERRGADQASVDGTLERAAARSPAELSETSRLHCRAIVGRGWQARAARTTAGMPDSSTILLVDDEDSIQTLLTYPLERDGYRVVQARDGDEALRLFREQQIDLVVLDLMLPKVDGLEVCRRMRAESTVPIVMLTARDDELDTVLGLELGADDYITKPFSIREFRSRVKALLRRAAIPPPSARVEEVIDDGDLRVDMRRRAVEVRGAPVRSRSSSSSSWRCSLRIPASSGRGGSCWSGFAAGPTTASRAPSMSTCGICGRRSKRGRTSRS